MQEVFVVIPEAVEPGVILRITQWFVSEGQSVRKAMPLLELETDKAIFAVECPADGVLKRILAPAGSEIRVGENAGVIFCSET